MFSYVNNVAEDLLPVNFAKHFAITPENWLLLSFLVHELSDLNCHMLYTFI